MTTLREAAQQALEALESLQGGCTDSNDGTVEAITVWCPEVIDALRAALAQQEQEPIKHKLTEWGFCGTCGHDKIPGESCARSDCPEKPVTTTHRREWQSLSEEEIQSIHDTYHKRMGPQEFARAVEAALKKKNQ